MKNVRAKGATLLLFIVKCENLRRSCQNRRLTLSCYVLCLTELNLTTSHPEVSLLVGSC